MSQQANSYSAFRQQFGAELELAQRNEAMRATTGRDYAWSRAARTHSGMAPGRYATTLFQIDAIQPLPGEPGEPYYPDPDVAEPEWIEAGRGAQIAYAQTDFLPRRQPEVKQFERPKERLIGQSDWRAPMGPHRPASVGRACVRWGWLADTLPDLALVGKKYSEWTQDGTNGAGQSLRYSEYVGHLLVWRGLEIAATASYPPANPVVEVFARLGDNEAHRTVLEVARMALQGALLGEPPAKGAVNKDRGPLPQHVAVEATKVWEDRELLPLEWWIKTGIMKHSAISTPQLLPIVYQNLASAEYGDIARHLPIEPHAMIKSYVAKLLETYGADEGRNHEALLKINKHVIEPNKEANLPKLIAIANGIMRQKDSNLDVSQRRKLLDVRSMFSVGDALLIVLNAIRHGGTPDEQAMQFEQDVLQAEIIDVLHVALQEKRAQIVQKQMTTDSLRLRYPGAPDETLTTIMGELTAPGNSVASVRARFRRGQQGVVFGRDAKRPGRGLLS